MLGNWINNPEITTGAEAAFILSISFPSFPLTIHHRVTADIFSQNTSYELTPSFTPPAQDLRIPQSTISVVKCLFFFSVKIDKGHLLV